MLTEFYDFPARSEITRCNFIGGTAAGWGGAIWAMTPLTVEKTLIAENTAARGSAIMAYDSLTITKSTIMSNYTGADATIVSDSLAPAVNQCLIYANIGGSALEYSGADSIVISCTDIFANDSGDWVGSIAGYDNYYGNFSANPRFCDTIVENLTATYGSPCLPTHNDCGVPIGNLTLGCYQTVTDPDSLFTFQLYSIDTLWSEFYVGNLFDNRTVAEIDASTINVDGVVSPVSWEIVENVDGFDGQTLHFTTLTIPILQQFEGMYGDSIHDYTVSGLFTDSTDFSLIGPVAIVDRIQMPGDVNNDGQTDISDVTYLVSYLFAGGEPPPIEYTADLDGSGSVDISDLSLLVVMLFG